MKGAKRKRKIVKIDAHVTSGVFVFRLSNIYAIIPYTLTYNMFVCVCVYVCLCTVHIFHLDMSCWACFGCIIVNNAFTFSLSHALASFISIYINIYSYTYNTYSICTCTYI